MSDAPKKTTHDSAREKFLALSLESTRKSYYPQLQKHLEAAKENEKRLQLLVDNLPAKIAFVDARERYILVNREYEKAFGVSRKQIIGKRVEDIFGKDNYNQVKEHIAEALSGKSVHFEIAFTAMDNTKLWLGFHYVPEIDRQGKVHGFYDLTMDLTEKKRAEKEKLQLEARLQQAQKMEAIGTLAGGIAHDFNNILSGIFGYSQLAKMHLSNPARAKDDIDQILQGAQKAADLVQQILTVSRKSFQKKQPVCVAQVIKEALKLLRATIPTTIAIKENLKTKSKVMADPVKIHQVIMNLCTNAYHAMRETGGELVINLTEMECRHRDCIPDLKIKPGTYLNLEVIDTGQGMDSKIIQKIFDPYFTTKTTGKGTGLGLAVVLGIIEEHQGYIRVFSRINSGSTFQVYLPVTQELSEKISIEEEKKTPQSGEETIMFVDDEAALRTLSKELLKGLGYSVEIFHDGRSAFEAYQLNPDAFDLVITDMTMPGMTGLELTKKILQISPGQPVILCTGYSEAIDRKKAISMGVTEYLEKPIVTKELAKTIRAVLDKIKRIVPDES